MAEAGEKIHVNFQSEDIKGRGHLLDIVEEGG
jgi:hypothetical protein